MALIVVIYLYGEFIWLRATMSSPICLLHLVLILDIYDDFAHIWRDENIKIKILNCKEF